MDSFDFGKLRVPVLILSKCLRFVRENPIRMTLKLSFKLLIYKALEQKLFIFPFTLVDTFTPSGVESIGNGNEKIYVYNE